MALSYIYSNEEKIKSEQKKITKKTFWNHLKYMTSLMIDSSAVLLGKRVKPKIFTIP